MESERLKTILMFIAILINKKNYDDDSYRFSRGICNILSYLFRGNESNLKLTRYENEFILNYLNSNKPSPFQYTEFTENMFWMGGGVFWWQQMEYAPETRQIRVDYIMKLIANIK